jgi:hypothetical protein
MSCRAKKLQNCGLKSKQVKKENFMSKLRLFCLVNLFVAVNLIQASEQKTLGLPTPGWDAQDSILGTPTSVSQAPVIPNPYARTVTPELRQTTVQIARIKFKSPQADGDGDKPGKSFSFEKK